MSHSCFQIGHNCIRRTLRGAPVAMAAAVSLAVSLALLAGSCANPARPPEPPPVPAPGAEFSSETGMRYVLPRDRLGSGPLPESSNSFSDWWRYPAEEQTWMPMASATAYNRDVVVGGETFIAGATDGESWTASAVLPDGSTINWGAITFHSSYNGEQNCFVSPAWIICNTTSLFVLWYTNSQCVPTGSWTMRFFNNGAQFHEGTFKVLPQIPPGKVPLADQLAYTDHYDNQCKKASAPANCVTCDTVNTEHCTIAKLGCWLTGACMILGYHGVSVTPPALNSWLIANSGYQGGNVDGYAVARYARNQGRDVFYGGRSTVSALNGRLCARGPQLAHVRKPGRTRYHHFVTVTGQDEQKTTYLINDPAGGVAIQLSDRYQDMESIRVFEGPEYVFRDDLSGVVITFHSPGELLVTDPQGRRAGLDPTTGASYNEIPGGSYEDEYIEDPAVEGEGMESKSLEIVRPEAGTYALTVTGTGAGTYDLQLRGYDVQSTPSGTMFEDVPINAGELHTYAFDFDKSAGSSMQVGGGFYGGGQRPRDVNRLLSYGNIASNRVDLPAGAASYALLVVCGSDILPATFQASLEGADVSGMFSPAPGASQLVEIPLVGGQNVLTLSAQGNVGGRVARDTDRIVFLVPNITGP